ncbi:hypothetical protein ES703_06177 [subsurface metagenome]
MKKDQKITKEMTIAEVIEKHPKTASVFMIYGLHCFGCPMAQSETLEQLARANQMDLKKLLKDLNKAAK